MTSALYASVFGKVISALQDVIFARTANITAETRLEEDLGLDSMDLTELLFHLEDMFSTSFSQAAILQFRRVAEIVDYLSAHYFQDAEVEEYEEIEALAA